MASIIITGANGNLGITVVRRLLKDGYHIRAVSGHLGAEKLPRDGRLEVSEVDLFIEEQAKNYVEQSLIKYPDLQAAVLLVGGYMGGNYQEVKKPDIDKMINLNFYTAFNIVKPLLTHFLNRADGGQFVFIGSRAGLNAAEGRDSFAYSMSKSLIFRMAEFINAEGKSKKVTATVLVPSTIDTETNRRTMPGSDYSKWVPAENIADAISFLLSETGQMLRDSVIKIYNRS